MRSAACARRLYACPAVHDAVRRGTVRCVQHLRLFLRLEVAVDRRSLAALHAVKLRRSAREHALVRVSVRPTRASIISSAVPSHTLVCRTAGCWRQGCCVLFVAALRAMP